MKTSFLIKKIMSFCDREVRLTYYTHIPRQASITRRVLTPCDYYTDICQYTLNVVVISQLVGRSSKSKPQSFKCMALNRPLIALKYNSSSSQVSYTTALYST